MGMFYCHYLYRFFLVALRHNFDHILTIPAPFETGLEIVTDRPSVHSKMAQFYPVDLKTVDPENWTVTRRPGYCYR